MIREFENYKSQIEGVRGNITILFLSPTKKFRTKMRRLFYLHKKAYQTYA